MEKRNIEEKLQSFSLRGAVYFKKESKVNPLLGMIRSIGEMATCFFYHKQKTRGFEDKRFFVRHLTIAVAEFIIHCFHSIYVYDCAFVKIEILPTLDTEEKFIGILAMETGIITYQKRRSNTSFSLCIYMAAKIADKYNLDISSKLEEFLEKQAK